MTARVTRLRIAGFKSFAEPVALDILPGLTGIVGPNGCGKSNVVEALRWAMGETSARSLRGGEMDDVIFAGTTARPSRNLAEVTITLERTEDALPAPFEAESELQLTRRIERGAGSAYRGNGREMRARDVQTMFADLASGARSSAMVSQGRVSAIVNARPEERRQILEEAGGITGLHARRHEAELKLRGAEANLSKAEDSRGQLESARDGLRKQARQAARYRNISALVRAAEAELLGVQHALTAAALKSAQAAQAGARQAVAAAEAACEEAGQVVARSEASVPGPRAAEAASRSALERARLESETLTQEAARAEASLAGAVQRVADLQADAEDAGRAEADAQAACARLAAEVDGARARLLELPAVLSGAQTAVSAAEAAVSHTQHEADAATRAAAEAAAGFAQAERERDAAASRMESNRSALDQALAAHALAEAALVDAATIDASFVRVDAAEQALATAWAEVVGALQRAMRGTQAEAAAKGSLERAQTDRGHAAQLRADAAARAERLTEALAGILAALSQAEAALVAPGDIAICHEAARRAADAVECAEAAVLDAERANVEATQAQLHAARAAQDSAEDFQRAEATRNAAHERLVRLDSEAETLAAQLAAADAGLFASANVEVAERAAREADLAASAQVRIVRTLAETRADAEAALAGARTATAGASADAARLAAEIQGLRAALASRAEAAGAAEDALEVPEGLERALGAALEDLQDYGLTEQGARFWRVLPEWPTPAARTGTTRLDAWIRAPDCLRRALSRIALLADGADGDTLHAALLPGDSLVSRAGDVWRWDGRVARAGAPNAASIRLTQRRRLREAEQAEVTARVRAGQAAESEAAAVALLSEVVRRATAAREAQMHADLAARSARDIHAQSESMAAQAADRHAALVRAASRASAERDGAASAVSDAEAVIAALPRPELVSARAEAAKAEAAAAAAALEQARTQRQMVRAAQGTALERLRAVEAAGAEWLGRHDSLMSQRCRLDEEFGAARAGLAEADRRVATLPNLDLLLAREAAAAEEAAAASRVSATALRAQEVAQAALDEARAAAAALETARVQAETRSQAQASLLARAEAEFTAVSVLLANAEAALAALPDAGSLAEQARSAAEAAAVQRTAHGVAVSRVAAVDAESARLEAAAPALTAEHADWVTRLDEAGRRRQAVLGRLAAAETARSDLVETPGLLRSRAARSGGALAEAEVAHAAAAAALTDAEAAMRRTALAQRDTDARLSALRESLVRLESAEEAALAALRGVLTRASERLGAGASLPECSDASEAEEERARRKWDRLQRERDDMGPVNLRADIELEEIVQKLGDIERDREELTTAIAKLRGAIGHLNREGRERLSAVFTEVDRHFRTLFTRMMGGGRAHLALTGSDDPLLAGLEIYAEPPGKRLSTLSLLSGGEQALTALSLIFAVFRCTPAPVAVLDEVDAPLDDANVDRFCTLMEDVVRDTGTRFLVVTHHQVTMSRMDRLFGVTMQERGVSRLLSVDLRRAAEMMEAAPQAVAA